MTSTIDTIRRESVTEAPPDVRDELCAAHQEVAAIVAELDLSDTALWAKAAEIVSDVVAEADIITAALTGASSAATVTRVPPIVRVRELATTQRRLFGVLDTRTTPDQRPVLQESAGRVRGLGQWLVHIARQAEVGSQ